MQDTSLELPSLNDALPRAQMARTRIWRLIQGYRGQPAADIVTLSTVLVRLSQLAADQREIVELDINPLLADSKDMIGGTATEVTVPWYLADSDLSETS